MPQERVSTRIGPLIFDSDFADPIVDVTYENREAKHETINDDFVIQYLGRRPDQISVEGYIYGSQLSAAEAVMDQSELSVRSERWTGKALPKSMNIDQNREADPITGEWTYTITIDLVEISGKAPILDDGSTDDPDIVHGGLAKMN